MAAESYKMQRSYTDPILNDATALANLGILGGHPYGEVISTLAYPTATQKKVPLWLTEHYPGSSSTSADQWPDALSVAKEVQDFMAMDYNAYVYWYIRRSYGLINDAGNVTKRGCAFAHFSRFVRPGYVRLDLTNSPQSNVFVTAFKGPNGELVVVVLNQNTATKSQDFKISGATGTIASLKRYTTSASKSLAADPDVAVTNSGFTLSMDASSATTLVYEPTTSLQPVVPAPGYAWIHGTERFEVADVAGIRLGSVLASDDIGLRSAVEGIAPRPGIFVARSTRTGISRRIQVVR